MIVSPCSNCSGDNLYRSKPVSAAGGYGPNLLPGLGTFWVAANFEIVVCGDCGLTRLFASGEALQKLPQSKKWTRIE